LPRHGWTDAAYAALEAGFRVYDPATLQSTLVKLVASFNREATRPSDASLQLTTQQTGSQTYYAIRNQKQPGFENRLYLCR